MSTTLTPIRSQNPFEVARLALIKKLLAIKAPAGLPSFPQPCDFDAAKNHLIEAAGLFDEWAAAIGDHLADNTSASFDRRSFEQPFTYAIDGNASYAFEQAAEAVLEERDAMRRAS